MDHLVPLMEVLKELVLKYKGAILEGSSIYPKK